MTMHKGKNTENTKEQNLITAKANGNFQAKPLPSPFSFLTSPNFQHANFCEGYARNYLNVCEDCIHYNKTFMTKAKS